MRTSLFSGRFFLRSLAIFALVITFVYIVFNSFIIGSENAKIQDNQLERLTNLVVSQAALSASPSLKNNDKKALAQLVEQIGSEHLIYDASIYNVDGIRIAASKDAQSVRSILGIDTPLKTASVGREQLVNPVTYKGDLIGFIRITFEKGRVTAISNHYYRNSNILMYSMILISFVSGILICLLLFYQRKALKKDILLKPVVAKLND